MLQSVIVNYTSSRGAPTPSTTALPSKFQLYQKLNFISNKTGNRKYEFKLEGREFKFCINPQKFSKVQSV